MLRTYALLFSAALAAAACSRPDRPEPAGHDLPKDGTFFIEARPSVKFRTTLTETWTAPHAGEGTLSVFAPVPPELPGQGGLSARLSLPGRAELAAGELKELGAGRAMLGLQVPLDGSAAGDTFTLKLEYEGTLYARALKKGQPPRPVPDLTGQERLRYLGSSATIDSDSPEFLRWLEDKRLRRGSAEDTMQFAHRAFTFLTGQGSYGGDVSGYEARRPTRVMKTLASDCGGFALLFTAIMRANGIPARTLFGRWALPQTGADGQYHVLAEFFVRNSGWVPVDIAGTLVHKPADPDAFFGRTAGRHLAFHTDTDLEPLEGFQHAWAQYLLLHWSGDGDFWKGHRTVSKWEVRGS